MAKCQKCGRKGIFLKVDEHSMCNECSALRARDKEAEEIAAKARDAETLLKNAMEKADKKAYEELAAKEHEARVQLDILEPRVESLSKTRDSLSDEIQKSEKQLKTLTNRLEKGKGLYKSMKYAVDNFMTPENVSRKMEDRLSVDFTDFLGVEPELKCYSMKSLKAAFRKNQKQIEEVTSAYLSHYTTKSIAALYKVMVMALSAELNVILEGLSYGKIDDALDRVKAITAQYYTIAAEGNQTIVSTLNKFIGQIEYLYSNAVKIEYEYYVQRERAKEEQRALREQMRQEAEERKALEAEKKKVEEEEKKYALEMERIQQQIGSAKEDDEVQRLKDRIRELTDMMHGIAVKKEEIVNLQNGKAGTIYIISNIGSFGENIFKIGMTRRLEPQDRVNELGDASVPFPFDVHSFIFSEDAPALETALHKELNDRRVNKVNLRKEFFHVTLDELEAIVERIDPSAPFERTMLAEQYHQSQSIDNPVDTYVDIDLDIDD